MYQKYKILKKMREKNEEYQYVPEGIKRCKRVPKKDPKKEEKKMDLIKTT